MDLAEWYAAGRWVALLDLIDMLPAACRLNEARANDHEEARYLASLPRSEEAWAPRTAEWDLHAQLMGDMSTKLDNIAGILIKVNGGSPGDIKPFPSPRTKLQDAMKQAEREWAEGFIEQFGFSKEDL